MRFFDPTYDEHRSFWRERVAAIVASVELRDDAWTGSEGAGAPTRVVTRRCEPRIWAAFTAITGGDARGCFALTLAAALLVAERFADRRTLVLAVPCEAAPAGFVPIVERVEPEDSAATLLLRLRATLVDSLRLAALPLALVGGGEEGRPCLGLRYLPLHGPGPAAADGPPLAIEAEPDGETLLLRVIGDARRYGPAYLEAFADALVRACAIFLAPREPLAAVELFAGLADRGRGPGTAPTTDILDGLARWVAASPEAPAVRFGDERLDYAALWACSGRVAAWLRTALALQPGDRVALALEPSPRAIVAMIAALRAGCAYVPLPLEAPAPSRAALASAAEARVVIDEATLATALREGAAEPPPRASSPEALAYVMFTSGSTGAPKPVPVTHRAVVRLFAAVDYVTIRPGDRILGLSNLAFDGSVFDIYGALLSGACVDLVPRADRGRVDRIAAFLRGREISVAFVPSGLFNRLAELDPGALAGIRELLFGGEQASVAHVRRVLAERRPGARLANVYGPTETTVFATAQPITALADDAAFVPIGRAIAATEVHVLDRQLRPTPIGVAGEICIGGCGLSTRGLDGEADPRFVADPFVAGARLYRSGDLGCVLADGSIRCLGRRDDQVKIRGFRVEPGEIEQRLRELPGVVDAAVLARDLGDDSGARELVAYVQAAQGEGASLRAALAERLPEWMVPARVQVLAALPLNRNGKVDRRALAALAPLAADAPADAPRPGAEAELAALWSELLGVDGIGREDDFFALGGHSLAAARVVTAVHARLGISIPLRELFLRPTVAALAELVELARGESESESESESETESESESETETESDAREAGRAGVPASALQRQIWLIEREDSRAPGSPAAYLMPEAFALDGPCDPERLEAALLALVARHDALRLRFVEVEGEPWVRVEAPRLLLARHRVAAAEVDETVARLRALEARTAFDLARDPPLRARLISDGDRRHVLLLTFHHIAVDGWSIGSLLRELPVLLQGGAAAFEGAAPSYLEALAALAASPVDPEAVAYWRARLAGPRAVVTLPADRPRSPRRSFAGGRLVHDFGRERTAGLHAAAARAGVTSFAWLAAAVAATLHRYTGERDVVLGTTLSGRELAARQDLVGLLIEPVPLRVAVDPEQPFAALVTALREALVGALGHDSRGVAEALAADPRPLYEVMLTMTDRRLSGLEADDGLALAPGLRMAKLPAHYDVSRFDLTLWFLDGEALALHVEYDADLFDRERIAGFVAHLAGILDRALEQPSATLASMPLVAGAELEQLRRLERGPAATTTDLRPQIEATLAADPEARALIDDAGEHSRGALDRRARALARVLSEEQGIGAGDRVGLVSSASAATVAGLLAVWRLGAAVVPLDPRWPAARRALISDDAGLRVVIGADGRVETRAPAPTQPPRSTAAGEGPDPGGEAPAYVIYTSGTSGQPKGVLVPHRALAAWVEDQRRALAITAADVIAHMFAWTFDPALFCAALALSSGATSSLSPPEILGDPEALAATLVERSITVLTATPGQLRALASAGLDAGLAALRVLISGGEAPTPALVERLRPGRIYANQYGPSEATCVSVEVLRPGDPALDPQARVSAGRPIAGVELMILDPQGRRVPRGIPGEIVVAGQGLALGYLARPASGAGAVAGATAAAAFIAHPDDPRRLAYRSGDLGRWSSAGTLELLGRADDQLKVRGYRIERRELEHHLRAAPGVEAAAVVARGEALIAFVVGVAAEPRAILEALRARLPGYMVPARVLLREALPLDGNGKIDHRALAAAVDEPSAAAEGGAAEARDALEAKLCAIWSEVLGVAVGPEDDLFLAGGGSLAAARIVSQVERYLGVRLRIAELFAHPDVRGCAALLRDRSALAGAPPLLRDDDGNDDGGNNDDGDDDDRGEGPDAAPASAAQRGFWLHAATGDVPWLFDLRGFYRWPGRLDAEALTRALTQLVARHELLRTRLELDDAGELWQRVDPPGPVTLSICARATALDPEPALRELLDERRPLLGEGAGWPWRATLVRLAEADALLVEIHHMIADARGLELFADELFAGYEAALVGRALEAPAPRLRYRDWSRWQRRLLAGERGRALGDWWRRTLAAPRPYLELPCDHPRPAARSYAGGVVASALDEPVSAALGALARGAGASPFMVMVTLLATWIHARTGQREQILGFPHGARDEPELDGVLANFVNPLPLRLSVDPTLGFDEQLALVRRACLDAYGHAHYPFQRIVADLGLRPVAGRAPLFDVGCTWSSRERPGARPRFEALHAAGRDPDGGAVAKHDLWLHVHDEGGRLILELEYAAELFERASVETFAAELVGLAGRVAADPQGELATLCPDLRPRLRTRYRL